MPSGANIEGSVLHRGYDRLREVAGAGDDVARVSEIAAQRSSSVSSHVLDVLDVGFVRQSGDEDARRVP